MANNPECSVTDCPRVTYAKRLCRMHYDRKRKTGVVGPAESKRRPHRECRVDGCSEPHKSKGFCGFHYQRVFKTGDAGGPEKKFTPIRVIDGTKQCRRCGEVKPTSDYHRKRKNGTTPHEFCRPCRNIQAKAYLYGVHADDVERLMSVRRCQGCSVAFDKNERRCIDHDHQTGHVRGVLCNACNLALGMMNDSPGRLRNLAAYLETATGAR